jgi:hypothetical protein
MIRFTFCNAPVNTHDSASMNYLYHAAAMYALQRPIASNVILPNQPVKDVIDFSLLCAKHNLLELYLWLSFRFPKIFIEREFSIQQRIHSLSLIERSLHISAAAYGARLNKSYRDTKQRLDKAHSPDSLPPMAWPDVRKSTHEYLKDIPPDKLYCYPHSDFEI